MATSTHIIAYKIEVSKLIHEFNSEMCQPVSFEDDAYYNVMLIAAPIFDHEGPIFDHEGNAAFNLSLGGFPRLFRAPSSLNMLSGFRGLALK